MTLEVDTIEEYINKRRFDPAESNKPFYFNYEMNDKIVVGNGSPTDHFRVCFTSFRLLQYTTYIQLNGGCYCIDGTYR